MKSTQLLALLTVLLYRSVQQCVPIISSGAAINTNITGLQSSAVTLIAAPKPKRQNQYRVSLKDNVTPLLSQQSPYEVSLGLNYIQNYYDTNQLNFMTRVVIQPSFFTIVFFISEQSTWSAAQVHYLVTSKSDMRLGNFLVDKPTLLMPYKGPSPKTVSISKDFGKWNGTSRYLAAYVFITGIQTKNRLLDLNIQSATANATTNLLNVVLALNNMDSGIEYLSLSYIIYQNANNFVDIQPISNIQSTIQTTFRSTKNNQFIGIVGIDSINLASYFNKGKSALQNFNRTQLQAFALAFQFQGYSFSTRQRTEGSVIKLSAGATPLNKGCANYSECKRQSGIFLNVDNQNLCIICRPNSEYSPITKTCGCLPDFYLDKYQNCVQLSSLCQPGEFYYQGTCFKSSAEVASGRCEQFEIYNTTSQSCTCKPGYLVYLSQNKNKCAPPCFDGLTFNYKTKKCQCLSNQYDVIGKCINCQDDLIQWNSTLGKCECIPGAMFYIGKCLPCSPYSKYNAATKKCQCNDGYGGTGVICRKASSFFTINSTKYTMYKMGIASP